MAKNMEYEMDIAVYRDLGFPRIRGTFLGGSL